ncbi:hypothetical protein ACCO45_006579 [Purpureocillium lilacinum]|uniref:Uncharacterized protein n=1 Tax=Purpureocillium lilacinum TaxID=33203 RepID=A0ACC4DPV9_PURLI
MSVDSGRHLYHRGRRRSSCSSAISERPVETVPKTKEYMDSLVPPDKDQFEHIAHVQAEKESEAKRRAREQRRSASLSVSSLGNGSSKDERAAAAARVIQKTFRGYRARREMQGYSLDAGTRWVTAIREAQFRQSTKPRARLGASDTAAGSEVLALEDPVDTRPSSARMNWKKASLVARRAGHDDLDSDSSSDSDDYSDMTPEEKAAARKKRERAMAERKQAARMMGLQYFLEMVDSKHRYGSNLRMYHEEWKKSDTTENFFYWLDYGGGKNIELDTCPRDRLEREQVRYLSREERQYYLVRVDDEGRLCWAKTGARIDTTEQYKDSIHGIVPADDTTPAFNPAAHTAHPVDEDGAGSDTSSVSSAESRREADRAAKYADSGLDESHGIKKVTHISASTIFNKLLRKSVRKNTWIFVADTSFRLYVGIKDSGAFQHSSFLQGSRISAAGLIKIKNGRLSSLSPLSGHYRPPASNFRAFVRNLKDEGADMSHVSISKSYTVLVGLETYVKTRRKGKDFLDKLFRRRQEEEKDKSESAEKERRVLEQQRREEEAARAEASTGDRVVEKLKSIPTHALARPAPAAGLYPHDGRQKRGLDAADRDIDAFRAKKTRIAVEILSKPTPNDAGPRARAPPIPRPPHHQLQHPQQHQHQHLHQQQQPQQHHHQHHRHAHIQPLPPQVAAARPPPQATAADADPNLTKHQAKVINGIKHELDRLHPQHPVAPREQGRKLRSQEATRFKSDLSAYFPDYDEVIGNDPKEQHLLNPETPIVVGDSRREAPGPVRGLPRPPLQPNQPAVEFPVRGYGDSLYNDVFDSQRIDFRFLEPQQTSRNLEDPLPDSLFEPIHKRAERLERSIRNSEKGRAQHEKDQIIRLLEGLQGHDWLRSWKKTFEPARAYFIKGCQAILEKFKNWNLEERRRKQEREKALAEQAAESKSDEQDDEERSAQDDEEQGEEEEEDDAEEEADEDRTMQGTGADREESEDVSTSQDDTSEASSPAKQLRQEAMARSRMAAALRQARSARPTPPRPPETPREFKSFFSKRYERESALNKNRRTGRKVMAWGHPLPELPEADFVLPEEYRDSETLKARARKKRRDKRGSKP